MRVVRRSSEKQQQLKSVKLSATRQSHRRRWRIVGCILIFAAIALSSAAAAATLNNAMALVAGDGELSSHLSERTYVSVAYDRTLPELWQQQLPWNLAGYTEFSLSYWGGCSGGDCGHVFDAGVIPMFRLQPAWMAKLSGYWEAGLGIHLISRTRIGPQIYSTGFQFSETAGMGILFGPGHRYEAGIRFMHESNADLKTPNDGMNFLLLRLALRWQ